VYVLKTYAQNLNHVILLVKVNSYRTWSVLQKHLRKSYAVILDGINSETAGSIPPK